MIKMKMYVSIIFLTLMGDFLVFAETCEPGIWGSKCSLLCSPNCAHPTCDQESGNCSVSVCKPGWAGPRCDECVGGPSLELEDIKAPCCAVMALPDGGALIAEDGTSPDRIYRVDHLGVVVPPYHNVTWNSIILNILLADDGDTVTIVQRDGTMRVTSLSQFNVTKATFRVKAKDVWFGSMLAPDTVILPDYRGHQIFTVNTTSRSKTVVNHYIRWPISVSVVGSGTDRLYVVVRYYSHRVDVYNHVWRFMRGMGGKGSADGRLSNPQRAVPTGRGSILVADRTNERVSEFSLARGRFLRHVLTKDSIGFPYTISLSGHHLWLLHETWDGNEHNYKYQRFVFCTDPPTNT